jgi:hypothetical protein
MVFLLAVAKSHRDHVAEITAILVYRDAVFLQGIVRVDDVVDILPRADGCGYPTQGQGYGSRSRVREEFGCPS